MPTTESIRPSPLSLRAQGAFSHALPTAAAVVRSARFEVAELVNCELRSAAAPASTGEPDRADLRALLLGRSAPFTARLSNMSSTATRLEAAAQEADVRGQELLDAACSEADQICRTAAAGSQATDLAPRKPSFWERTVSLVAAATAPAAAVSAPTLSPRVLRNLVDAAEALVGAGLATTTAERVRARHKRWEKVGEELRAIGARLQRVLGGVRAEAANEPRPETRYDLVLDGSDAVRNLMRGLARIDWHDPVIDAVLRGDGAPGDAALYAMVHERLADDVAEIAQHPLQTLLPKLLGCSPEQAFELFVLGGRPLAPIDHAAGTSGFSGLAIGVYETTDRDIGRILDGALHRDGDRIVLKVERPALPPDVLARINRGEFTHRPEVLYGYLGELMKRGSDPDCVAPGTRDYLGALPPPIAEAQLRVSITAAAVRGEPAESLARWLPLAADPPAASGAAAPGAVFTTPSAASTAPAPASARDSSSAPASRGCAPKTEVWADDEDVDDEPTVEGALGRAAPAAPN